MESVEGRLLKTQDESENKKQCHEEDEGAGQNFPAEDVAQGESETPEEKALRNPLVVKTIAGSLSCSSLLKCRLLNKLWLALCTQLLYKFHGNDEKDKALRIKFRYCEEAGTYIKMCQGVFFGEMKTLESFNQVLAQQYKNNPTKSETPTKTEIETESPRSSFPCNNFEFKNLNLNHPQIIEFFQLYGSEIRGLRLGFCQKDEAAVSEVSFTDLLLHKAKNVECLTILRVPFERSFTARFPYFCHLLNIQHEGEDESIFPGTFRHRNLPPFRLPHLRCLRTHFPNLTTGNLQRLEREIILSSPRLETIHVGSHLPFPCPRDFDYFTSISRAHLITRVEIEPLMYKMDMLKRFAHSAPPPRLTHLTLSLKYVDSTEAAGSRFSITFDNFLSLARPLLESSKDSLEYFSMPAGKERVTWFLNSGEIPPLKNVREVRLCCGRVGPSWPIPIAPFNRIFRNARKLSLVSEELDGVRGFLAVDNEPATTSSSSSSIEKEIEIGVIPQITSLELIGSFTREFWDNFPSTFCNVQKLSVRNVNLLPVLPIICNFKTLRLKRLELNIPVADRFFERVGAPRIPSPALVFPGLDAAFTGFSKEPCLLLRSIYPTILDGAIVKEQRINSSLLDLEYLEQLHVKFLVPPNLELPENILTIVSGAYAFLPLRMKSELGLQLGLAEVCIDIEFTAEPEMLLNAEPDLIPSALSNRRQHAENVLKPLLQFVNASFKHDNSSIYRLEG